MARKGVRDYTPGKRVAGRLSKIDSDEIQEAVAGLIEINNTLEVMIKHKLEELSARGMFPDKDLIDTMDLHRSTVLGLYQEQRIRFVQEVKLRKELGQDPIPALSSEEAQAELKMMAAETFNALPAAERAAWVAAAEKEPK